MLDTAIYIAASLIVILIPAIYILKEWHKHSRSKKILSRAIATGQDQPASLHPVVDTNSCIGSGACIKACPERDVLGLIHNKAVLINPSRCIGHGACMTACPVNAIELVIGTEKRGVDIPHVTSQFESNVDGIYIAGELGGMGLIQNAVIQGQRAIGFIADRLEQEREIRDQSILDVVIIGAGPAGIAASLRAKKENLSFVVLDQEGLGGTVLIYPRNKLVTMRPVDLPIYGKLKYREIRKEQLLEVFKDVFKVAEINVYEGYKVSEIEKCNTHFRIITNKENFEAKKVLLAIGRSGSPKKLNVKGEKQEKVQYRLIDPEKYKHKKILVVGGGDSAIEAAVGLSLQAGNTVHLSYRQENLFRIKEGNREKFADAVKNGRIMPVFSSNVTEILPDKVVLKQNDVLIEMENDYVFIMIGGELPTEFLNRIGIEVTRKFGERLDA